MPRDPKQFPTRLRAEINRQGLTINALARRIDPSNPARGERNLYRWLAGGNMPSPSSLASLADALGVTRQSLLGDEEEGESVSSLLRRLAACFEVAG